MNKPINKNSLKPGWKMVKFGDIAENVIVQVTPAPADSKNYIGLEHMDAGSLHIHDWGTDIELKGKKLVMKKGDVLFARRNAYLRRVAIAPHDGLFSAHGMVLRPKPGPINPDFFPFFLQSDVFMERAIGISVGSLSPTINWTTLREEEFPIPPWHEQERVAELAWAADEAVEKYTSVQKAVSRVKVALWQDVLAQKTGYVHLGDIASVRNGTTPSRSNSDYWENGTVPWLSSGKIHDRYIGYSDEYITEVALQKVKSSLIPANSVLVAMIGQGKTRGSAAYLEFDACINQNLAAIIPHDSSNGKYIFFCLDNMYEHLRNWSQGSNQGALNCRLIEEFTVPFPSENVRQHIVSVLESAEKQNAQITRHLIGLRTLMDQLIVSCYSGDMAVS